LCTSEKKKNENKRRAARKEDTKRRGAQLLLFLFFLFSLRSFLQGVETSMCTLDPHSDCVMWYEKRKEKEGVWGKGEPLSAHFSVSSAGREHEQEESHLKNCDSRFKKKARE
jgi:hypothetical protein